jgi:hypothetical protein
VTASDDPKVLAAQAAASASIAQDAAAATKTALEGLAGEVRRLREAIQAHPTHAQVRRASWVSIAAVLLICAGGLLMLRNESTRERHTLRVAVLKGCEQVKNLEVALQTILEEAAAEEDPEESAERQARRRRFSDRAIATLQSPPCSETVPQE